MKKILLLKGALAILLVLSVIFSSLSLLAVAATAEADAFCNAVSELEGKSEITEQAQALVAAEEALAAYLAISGNKKTDAAISSKYRSLVAIKNDMFIHYVSEAVDAHESGNYPATRENLNLAEAILLTLGEEELTNAALGFRSEYMEIEEELREPEETCANYVLRAKAAKEAKNFAEAKRNYDSAKLIEKNLSLDGYPGIEEAAATLSEVQAYLASCTVGAAGFLAAVDNVYSAGNFFEGVEAAYEAYEALEDTTVTGVPEAKSTLDLMVVAHNSGADKANAMVADMNSVIYGLILGSEKGTGNPFIDWVNKTFG